MWFDCVCHLEAVKQLKKTTIITRQDTHTHTNTPFNGCRCAFNNLSNWTTKKKRERNENGKTRKLRWRWRQRGRGRGGADVVGKGCREGVRWADKCRTHTHAHTCKHLSFHHTPSTSTSLFPPQIWHSWRWQQQRQHRYIMYIYILQSPDTTNTS